MVTDRLRIEPKRAAVINDYRIHDGHVEVRTLDPAGRPLDAQLSTWRSLNANELEQHFVLSTVVAEWLQHNHPEIREVEQGRGDKHGSDLLM